MATRVLDVGPGAFILIFMWALNLVIVFFARKSKKGISIIVGFTLFDLIVTLILLLGPRNDSDPSPFVEDDYFFIRLAVLIITCVGTLAGLYSTFKLYGMKPVYAEHKDSVYL
eukprot:Nk52_evm67s1444 gene=Nk52_evmTU67s1444